MNKLLLSALLLSLSISTAFAASGLPRVTYTHTDVDVAVTSTATLAANTSRAWALVENDSDTAIYCKVGATAVVNEGIGIHPAGSYEISPRLGNFTTAVINCIHGGTGTKVMLVIEAE